MARLRIEAHRRSLPLRTPYVLSFGPVAAFETVYVAVRGEGRLGVGEITPLPGYGRETLDSVRAALEDAFARLKRGESWREVVAQARPEAPFAASGLACAFETWQEGVAKAFVAPLGQAVPLSGFCGGRTPEEAAARAEELVQAGYADLKMKVGAQPPGEDAARVAAVAAVLPVGVRISLDANQGYDLESAQGFCSRVESLDAVRYLEQPFPRQDWDDNARLAERTALPIMLDESVWDEADLDRAAGLGVSWVKLKLCKLPGMQACHDLLRAARRHGLSVVFGNGVQTALGNHLEARVYVRADLQTAFEGNGFAKPTGHPFAHGLRIESGTMRDAGIPTLAFLEREPALRTEFSVGID